MLTDHLFRALLLLQGGRLHLLIEDLSAVFTVAPIYRRQQSSLYPQVSNNPSVSFPWPNHHINPFPSPIPGTAGQPTIIQNKPLLLPLLNNAGILCVIHKLIHIIWGFKLTLLSNTTLPAAPGGKGVWWRSRCRSNQTTARSKLTHFIFSSAELAPVFFFSRLLRRVAIGSVSEPKQG